MAPAAEVTVICIDNSSWLADDPIFVAQKKAIKFYVETKIKCNRNNLVGIFVMSSLTYGIELFPTNDLKEILRCLKGICEDSIGGKSDFSDALDSIRPAFYKCPQDMKRRLLMFVGSPIKMHGRHVKPRGEMLKEKRIALNIFNFYLLDREKDPVHYSILYGTYRYARKELGDLVTTVEGNSFIVDVDESSVVDMISRYIFQLPDEQSEKAKAKVNVEEELEQRHNEKK